MKNILITILLLSSICVGAQSSFTSKTVIINGVSKINPRTQPTSFAPLLKSLEAPTPGGSTYKDFLNSQKIKSARLYPGVSRSSNSIIFGESEDPIILNQMGMRSYIAQIDKEGIYKGGTPLDNTLSMSEDYLLASVNSFLWAYDLKGDSNLFVDEHGSTYTISFAEFGKDYILNPGVEFPFDPKLLYIPKHDKFIFTFLSGRTSSDSKIIVGFSSTNDPRDPWNVYMLPGNPRGLDQWTDFPMIGFDRDHFFLSINLLKVNTSWQLGFEGSIIWQMPLEESFAGDSSLNTVMYDDILFNGTKIRNLTPVQPGDEKSQSELGILFLSNRNFDLKNDSLFLVEISADNELTTTVKQMPISYGMPPNGIQGDDDPNDFTDGLQTNDARFLGAVKYTNVQNDTYVEFVGNTKDFSSARVGIFHGIIHTTPTEPNPHITANIIGVDSLDFGYPNITYVNNGQGCYEGTLIAFNHTSFTTFAGVSAIRHNNTDQNDGYSNIIRLKEGDGYVRRISGSYERWGDYFGIQTVPNHPSEVYTGGFYGTDQRSSSTWFNHLSVSDTGLFSVNTHMEVDPYLMNMAFVTAHPSGGYVPYAYQWSDGTITAEAQLNLLSETENSVIVTDAKDCVVSTSINDASPKLPDVSVYPNPVTDNFNINFFVNKSTTGSFLIYDMLGKLIVNLGDQNIGMGNNVFTFSTRPLLKGAYLIIIKDDQNNNIVKESFVKL